jgi:glyoxylase-like metal-dependent hydrolase (beta-lactamase superfamily II)
MRVFDLPVHRANCWIFNCYLLSDTASDSVVAVDAGLPVVTRRALAVLRSEIGREPGDVAVVAGTHGHPDHVGGIADLQQASDAGALLPQKCSDYLAGEQPRSFPMVESSVRFMAVWGQQRFELAGLRDLVATSRRTGFGGVSPAMQTDFAVSGFLGDGDEVPGAPGWVAISSPGHTDDSTCFYHAESATLLSGDAVATHDGTPWFNPEYVDLEASRETEERLRSLEVRHLLPGHGEPVTGHDVWTRARSADQPPVGKSVLTRCSRRLGRWGRH